MLDSYLQHTLAQVDDLTELKVTLIALRLLELKQSDTSAVSAGELAAHPALRDGLGFAPDIALNSALQRAVTRGSLLMCDIASLDEPRYFQPNAASRQLIDTLMQSAVRTTPSPEGDTYAAQRTVTRLARAIERLELVEAYRFSEGDLRLVIEWLAQGYTENEITSSVQHALSVPRARGTPPRDIAACMAQVTARPPQAPSEFYAIITTRTKPLPDEIIAFRELAGRLPDGREYQLVRAATGIYGVTATLQMMRRRVSTTGSDIDALIPLLAEQQEAELALQRAKNAPNLLVQEVLRLYESVFGLPPTSRVAQDVSQMAGDIPDITVWRRAFEFCAQRNKRDWSYIVKIVQNPSPAVFELDPINDAAQFAFNEYKRRVSFGVLDGIVAQEINEIAQSITDTAVWKKAFDTAARSNALNWNYIKKVLTSPPKGTGEDKDGKRKQRSSGRRRGVSRRPQVEEATEAEREAARERARQRIEERAKRRAPNGGASAGE